jgi:hypothetical protein
VCRAVGELPETGGFRSNDVSNPVEPREVSFFDMSGPHSIGVHYISFMDGRYAHISTGAPDFESRHRKDNQACMTVDLADPVRPREVGRWWMPGHAKKMKPRFPPRHSHPFDAGYRPHHTLCYPERPDRAYIGYIDGGVVILDISDKGAPRLIGRLGYHAPFPGLTHTVLPLFERDLLIDIGSQPLNW